MTKAVDATENNIHSFIDPDENAARKLYGKKNMLEISFSSFFPHNVLCSIIENLTI